MLCQGNLIKVSICCKFFRCGFQEFKNRNINIFDPSSFEDYFLDRKKILQNVQRRKLELDTKVLFAKHDEYTELSGQKDSLEKYRAEIAEKMKSLKGLNSPEIQGLKSKGREIKLKLKNLLDNDSGLRSTKSEYASFLPKLPVPLHKDTPLNDTTIHETPISDSSTSKSHLELLGNDVSLRCYSNNNHKLRVAYLTGEAALFEHNLNLRLKAIMRDRLAEYHYVCFSDLVKKFVSRTYGGEGGVSIMHSNEDDDLGMVLVGGGVPAFIAYLASHDLTTLQLPYKCYSYGSSYREVSSADDDAGLHVLSQNTQGQLFAVAANDEQADELFEEQSDFLTTFYHNCKLLFRVEKVGVQGLKATESRRTNYHLYSPSSKQWHLTACVVCHGDGVGRRYGLRGGAEGFVRLVSAVAFKTPSLIAAFLEQHQSSTCLQTPWIIN